jgi:hypothetical protein
MKTEIRDQRSETPTPAEQTLRLIARLSAPQGLEERVQAGLRAAARTYSPKACVLRWLAAFELNYEWLRSPLLRAVAAAAIAAVVIVGGWSVSARFHPAQSVSVQPRGASQGGFSSAGAKRTPQTLNGPILEVPTLAHPTAAAPVESKPAANPHTKTSARHGKPSPAKNSIAPTSAEAPSTR